MCRGLIILVACLIQIQVYGQTYDVEAVKTECSDVYPDESSVIYNSLNRYSFYKSSSNESPITGKLESTKVIARLRTNERLVYYETTNSYSQIRNFSADEYIESTSRFKNVSSEAFSKQYESDGIFHNDFFVNPLRVYTSETGIYKLEYTKLFSDYKFLAAINFSGGTATLNDKIEILVPDWLELELLEQNFDSFEITKSEKRENDGVRYTYTWNNIPKFENDHFSPSSRHYLPHIILVYKQITDGSNSTPLMPDTDALYAWYNSLAREIGDKPEKIEPLVAQFKDMPKGDEQLDAVHSWIRDNIRYIAFESGIAGFKPESCQNVYDNRYGDCKGMANLCKNTLIALGYDARLAWIGTRNEVPYGYEIPSLVVDNHMITAVKLDDRFVFIDPTETYGRTEEYAFRIQGRPVMIEDKDTYILTNVPQSDLESDRILRTYDVSFNDSIFANNFKVTEQISGEPKKNILSGFNYTFAKDRTEALESYLRPNNTGSFTLSKSEGLDKAHDHITFAYDFTSTEGVIDLGNEYYLDIDPTYDLEGVEVNEDRKAPWFFNQKYLRETHISFKIPEGYIVSYQPESFRVDNDDFLLSVAIEKKGNSIEIFKEIKIYNGVIKPEFKNSWEDGLGLLKEYYEDRLVISKE